MNNKQRMMIAEVAHAIVGDRFALEIGRRIRKGVDLKDSWDEHIEHVAEFAFAQLSLSIYPYPKSGTKAEREWHEFTKTYVQQRYRQTLRALFISLEDRT